MIRQGMFVKQSTYNRILIDCTTDCTSINVQTEIKLKPEINWINKLRENVYVTMTATAKKL